jgi:hypothetical protein
MSWREAPLNRSLCTVEGDRSKKLDLNGTGIDLLVGKAGNSTAEKS